MKKIFPILLISALLLSSCSIDWNDEKDKKISELEKHLEETLNKKEVKMTLENIPINTISTDYHLLKCKGLYDSSLSLLQNGGPSEWAISGNSENFEMNYIDDKISMFGTQFTILLDSTNFLIGMRTYDDSGLTEILHLNKANGLMIDSKTYTKGLGDAPSAFDTIFSCQGIQ